MIHFVRSKMAIKTGVYHPRNPKSSSLWLLFNHHFEHFVQCYEERFEKQYGYLRNVIRSVMEKYLRCGDLKEGFARVKCENCQYEFLLALICYSYYTSFDLLVSF